MSGVISVLHKSRTSHAEPSMTAMHVFSVSGEGKRESQDYGSPSTYSYELILISPGNGPLWLFVLWNCAFQMQASQLAANYDGLASLRLEGV